MNRFFIIAGIGLATGVAGWAHEERFTLPISILPEGYGLSAKYPGDRGIRRDPHVLFVEDFEAGDVKAIGARWGNVSHPENMDLPREVHAGSAGRRSLHIAHNGHLYAHTNGVDTMFARLYVKFHTKTGYLHHGVMQLIADRVPTPWPKGGAGLRPPGDQGFTTELGPTGQEGRIPPPGAWHFYSYWHKMKPDGRGDYWGNLFDVAKPEPIQPGRWYCVEAMLKSNSAQEVADGEQAFWVDGKLAGRFTGICWRSSDKLKINTFWLIYYITEFAARYNHDTATDRVEEAWFDDIVVSTEYVGPIKK